MKYSTIILAAGGGLRTGLNMNKILIEINGQRVIDYSLNFFLNDPNCGEIILVVSKRDFSSMSKDYKNKNITVILGGLHRQDSVYNALKIAVYDYVLVHDGARPFISNHAVSEIYKKLTSYPSITLGVKVKDTIQVVQGNRVVKTLDRKRLILTQTPQGFDKNTLLKAHELAAEDVYYGTDDTVLVEKYLDIMACVVNGDYRNIKLTTQDDIKMLEVILK